MQPGIHVLPVCCLVVGVLSYSRLARNILQPRELMLTGCVVNVWSPCLTLTCDITLWPCGISCASGSTLYSYLWHISVVPCCNKVVSRGGCFQELSFFYGTEFIIEPAVPTTALYQTLSSVECIGRQVQCIFNSSFNWGALQVCDSRAKR